MAKGKRTTGLDGASGGETFAHQNLSKRKDRMEMLIFYHTMIKFLNLFHFNLNSMGKFGMVRKSIG